MIDGVNETNITYAGIWGPYVNRAYNAGKRTRESLEAEAEEESIKARKTIAPLRETEGKKVDIYA